MTMAPPFLRNLAAIGAAIVLALAGPALAGPAVTPLVSVEWLAANAAAPDLRLLDLRPAEAFAAGHVPGTVRSDYPGAWRAEVDGVPAMLPPVPALEAAVSALGIGPDTSVVLLPAGTDAAEFGAVTWVYFILKYLGHDAVAILDGGTAAWVAAGNPVESGEGAKPAAAAFVAAVRPDVLATTEAVAGRSARTVLVDARTLEEYLGDKPGRLTTRAGRIPGAVHLAQGTLYDKVANRLLPGEALASAIPTPVVDAWEIIAYCNTGHWASTDWFVLHELLGRNDARLYAGSMVTWSRTSEPVETGPAN